MFTQSVVVVVVVVVFRLLAYCWERDLWYLIRLFTRSFIAKKLACWETFLKAWCCLSDWKFLRKKILLLIPLFYLRHFTNKESEPVRPCQSMKNGMWIRLKIDSPRGTESEKQQSPKADRSSPRDIFLSRCMNVVTSYPSSIIHKESGPDKQTRGPAIIWLTWYAGPEFCQKSACSLTFGE